MLYRELSKYVNFLVNRFFNIKLKSFILLVFLCVNVNFVVGQYNSIKKPKFNNFSLPEGLSQSSVLCILQDSKGFLWFGTRDGLNKFDGHTFKVYRHNSKIKNSLSSSFINSLYEDNLGNIWVGTLNGLNKFNPNTEVFERLIHLENNESITNNRGWCITKADDQHLWIGTDFGLEKLNINTNKITHFKHEIGKKNSDLHDQIKDILRTKDDMLWIYTTKNLALYNPKLNTFKHYKHPQKTPNDIVSNDVATIYQDKNNTIWLGFRNGLAVLNKEKDKFEFAKIKSGPITEITDAVRTIKETTNGDLWVGTYNGLYIIDKNKNFRTHILHDENESYSLSQNSIYKIYEDTKGDFWIGTYSGGVNYYDRSLDVFKHITSGSNNTKLNYKVTSSIIEDAEHNLWIATEGGGINFLNNKTKKFSYFTHNEANPNSLSANNVKSMILTQKGNFWIGTHDGGLNFLDPRSKPFVFKKYKNNQNDINSISHNRVISLLEDDHNNIWIGTSGGGLNLLNPKNDEITRFDTIQQIVGNIIYTISKSSQKNILYVGGNKGLCTIDAVTHKITPVNYKLKDDIYTNTYAVLCVYEDLNKNLWIGTEGDGLYYYNKTLKKSIKYGASQGIPNEVIYSIIPDNSTNLWLSTNNGLVQFDLTTNLIKTFNASDGVLGNEFNYGSSLRLTNGEVIFGGVDGITIFNPNDIKRNSFIPPVSITSVLVNNKLFPKAENIILKHNQNVFSFNFVGLSFSKSNKNEYAHKLEGFDKEWNYIGTKKSARYTNLDAGTYVFKVKASNNDGVWNEIGDTITVTIKPPFWKTWWAYLLYLIVLITAFFVIRKYILLRIYEKNELKQERIDKGRIEEINKMKLQLFTNISHEFRTPLTLILGPLERMVKNKKGDEFIQKQHKIMYRNTNVLLQLVNQFLDFRKSETGKLKLKASKSDMVSFVKNVKKSFNELANQKQIEYTIKVSDPKIKVWFDKVNFKKVLYNLLSNAFKYTPEGGRISIHVFQHVENGKKQIKIEISDTGKGMDKEAVQFIFDRYYRLAEDQINSGYGIGLSLTKNIVTLHNGTINVKSEVGKGSTFSINLPLGKGHLNEDEMVFLVPEQETIKSQVIINEEEKTVSIEEKEDTEKIKKSKVNKIVKSDAKLLIVEDNEELRSFIKSIFIDTYTVFEAQNGKQAIELANNNPIDLIISDIMMPEMDGVELCNYIKTNLVTSHIPVILLTARTAETYKELGYRTGADAYITKPFVADILAVRVANLLKYKLRLIENFKKDAILKPKELTITSEDELFLQKAIEIVEKHIYDTSFTIDIFVDEMFMSRSVLYRKLKALTNQSIAEFIKTIKLKRAGQLLQKTKMTISEIAFELGYNDLKHFRKSFQKLFKELPSAYRQRSKNESKSKDSEK